MWLVYSHTTFQIDNNIIIIIKYFFGDLINFLLTAMFVHYILKSVHCTLYISSALQ